MIEVQELSYFRVTREDLLSLKATMQKGLDNLRKLSSHDFGVSHADAFASYPSSRFKPYNTTSGEAQAASHPATAARLKGSMSSERGDGGAGVGGAASLRTLHHETSSSPAAKPAAHLNTASGQQHGILQQTQAISPIPSTSSASAQSQDQQLPEGQVLQYLYFCTSKASKLSTSPPQRASPKGLEQGEDEKLVSLTSRDRTRAHAHSPARKTHEARDSAAGNGASDVRGVAAADACDTGAEGQVTAFLSLSLSLSLPPSLSLPLSLSLCIHTQTHTHTQLALRKRLDLVRLSRYYPCNPCSNAADDESFSSKKAHVNTAPTAADLAM